ncbi:hypothetical protein LOK49_LG01G01518 [Camellia lanceoleosa]|uniref:Uncharacterized protein n=1 Tax=Camellia lanceoleosa TaxID=1840588 RepID=A0ACC0J0F1_9ERIC|nr:hypothetical protein LOK49_LG01G01518 [Camellia lanceoleosa]
MDFSWCSSWVQVHGLPLEKLTKRNGEIIGAKIGRLIRVEAHCEGLILYRNFLRIRVEIDVTKPILRGFSLRSGPARLGHDRHSCKFVSREAGNKFGYGPQLRTGIARLTGFPIEYYRKKVDDLVDSVRPVLHQTGSPEQGSPGKITDSEHANTTETRGFSTDPGIVAAETSAHARPDVYTTEVSAERDRSARSSRYNTIVQNLSFMKQYVDMGPNLVGFIGAQSAGHLAEDLAQRGSSIGPIVPSESSPIGHRYFVTEPTDSIQAFSFPMGHAPQPSSPLNIEELSPSTSPIRMDLKTLVVDNCMSQVFHSLSIKRKADGEEDRPVPKFKVLKCSDKSIVHPPAVGSANTASALITFPQGPLSEKPRFCRRGRGKKQWRRAHQQDSQTLFEVQVVAGQFTQLESSCGVCPPVAQFDDCCSQSFHHKEDCIKFFSSVAWISWFVWEERNAFVFTSTPVDPLSTIQGAQWAQAEFLHATESSIPMSRPS